MSATDLTQLARRRPVRLRASRLASSVSKRPLAIVGAVIIFAWLVVAVFAAVIAPANPLAQTFTPLSPPSSAHLFGTDELGRDIFSRVIYGARLSLLPAVVLIGISVAIGSTLGVIAGYFRGWVDSVIMRLTDLVFAFPAIILALVITASLGPGLQNAVLALVIVSWPAYARVVRGLVLSIGDSDYVKVSRLLGASSRRAIARDVLPNFIGPVLVLAMLDLGGAILLLAGLSFLGLGSQPPAAEWGQMVSEGVGYFQYWWMTVFPGLAIFTVVLAFNFIGDSLRDIFDPRTISGQR